MPNKKIKLLPLGQKITKLLWIVFLASFLLPRRFLILSLEDNVHGQIITFTSWFFYWVEFLLPVILIGFLVFFQKASLKNIPKITWSGIFLLMVLCGAGIFLHEATTFDALFLLRLIELWVVSYLIASQLISLRTLLTVLVVALGFQGILGLTQLAFQKSLGLSFLGEPTLSPDTLGIGKIDIGETKYIRPVGTLVHANAWGSMALLAIGLLSAWYASLMDTNKQSSLQKIRTKIEKNVWVAPALKGIGLFFGICALLSFSRGVWLGLGMIILALLWNRKYRIKILAPLLIALVAIGTWQWSLIWQRIVDWKLAIFSRTEMLAYALDLINLKPFGVGIGKFTLMLESDFSQRMFAPWELQPVHNFFLLAGAELGVPAIFVLLFVTLFLLWKSARHGLLSLICVLALLPSLLSDHFFWTDFSMLTLLIVTLTVSEIFWQRKRVSK